jgi:ribosomal protein RSM22 (predicted rRNA methylase)
LSAVLKTVNYRRSQDAVYRERHHHLWFLANGTSVGYFVLRRIFSEIAHRVPEFKPQSAFHWGASTGYAAWALKHTLMPKNVTLLESNHDLWRLGTQVTMPISPKPTWMRAMSPAAQALRSDLVLASYSLEGLKSTQIESKVQDYWRHTSDVLVLVEQGTENGFAALRTARDFLLSKHAGDVLVIAPCPHALKCPIVEGGKCIFGQQMPRTSLPLMSPLRHVRLPAHMSNFLLERFSYLVVRRRAKFQGEPPANLAWARVVNPARRARKQVLLDICKPDGELETRIVSKGFSRWIPGAYAEAKSIRWGDKWPFPAKTDLR